MNNLIKKIEESDWKYNDRIAVADGDNSISYCELEEKTNILSIYLQNYLKNVPKASIIIYMDRSVNFIVSILAIVKAGYTYIPIERGYPEKRIIYIIQDSAADLVLSDKMDGCDNFCEFVNVVTINSINNESYLYVEPYNHKAQNSDVCYVIYTSGSTGNPKGVKISFENLYNLVDGLEDRIYCSIKEYVNIALIASFLFDASIKQIFCALLLGHKLVIAEQREKYFPKLLIKFFLKNNIYLSDITPTLLKSVLKAVGTIKQMYLPNILLIGGEVLTYSLINEMLCCYQSVEVFNVYGPTECCVDVSCFKVDISKQKYYGNNVPIGVPLKNIELKILDRKNNEFVDVPNLQGELCIGGKCIGSGYTKKNEQYNLLYREDKCWYCSGDMAYKEKNGNFVIVGRYDEQVKINGYRIELGEVSNCLMKHTNIVFAYTLIKENQLVIFFSLKKKEKTITVREYLEQYLPKYMVPVYAVQLDVFPITDSGKIDSKLIKRQFETGVYDIALSKSTFI